MTTSHARIAAVYNEVLSNRMGLETTVHGCAVRFEPVPGLTTQVILHENDPEYLQVQAGFNGAEIGLPTETVRLICGQTTAKVKGAKATVDSDNDVLFSVEMLVAAPDCLPNPDYLQTVLPRALSMLVTAVNRTLTEFRFATITFEERLEQDLG